MSDIMHHGWRYKERMNDPAHVALRAYAEATKGVKCPICNGVESCDHTVRERLLADLGKGVKYTVGDPEGRDD